ncbi:hypothetical protein Syun_003873 [Stephania yunnanensis]|uniref:Uncharacterized protein n=1 Tax=Stephania yunnanensis TaxID=152371 RepID=A0AAP0Q4C0_9MAGN
MVASVSPASDLPSAGLASTLAARHCALPLPEPPPASARSADWSASDPPPAVRSARPPPAAAPAARSAARRYTSSPPAARHCTSNPPAARRCPSNPHSAPDLPPTTAPAVRFRIHRRLLTPARGCSATPTRSVRSTTRHRLPELDLVPALSPAARSVLSAHSRCTGPARCLLCSIAASDPPDTRFVRHLRPSVRISG